jgi:hypothetical protein
MSTPTVRTCDVSPAERDAVLREAFRAVNSLLAEGSETDYDLGYQRAVADAGEKIRNLMSRTFSL